MSKSRKKYLIRFENGQEIMTVGRNNSFEVSINGIDNNNVKVYDSLMQLRKMKFNIICENLQKIKKSKIIDIL